MLVHLVSTGGLPESVLPLRITPETTFDKVMSKWYAQHRIPQGQAKFTVGGRELRPRDTPTSVGLQPRADGSPLTVYVTKRKPVWGTPGKSVRPNISSTTVAGNLSGDESVGSESDDLSPEHEDEEEEDDEGEPISCDFSSDESTALGGDGLSSDDLSTEDESQSADGSAPTGIHAYLKSTAAKLSGKQRKAQAVGGSRRVVFRAVAEIEGSKTPSMLKFSLARNTKLDKLMATWAKHHAVQMEAARFMIGGRELSKTDTPLGLAVSSVIPEHLAGATPLWNPGKAYPQHLQEIEVRVLPRRSVMPVGLEGPAKRRRAGMAMKTLTL